MPRVKKKELTEEEILKKKKDRALKELEFIPEPSYQYAIGCSVSIGNLKDVVIKERLENGKLYLVEYKKEDENIYMNYFDWLSIRPVVTQNESLINKGELADIYYSQRELYGLLTMIYRFGVDFNPDYQREYVWTQKDKEALIDSIFRGIDIGKFVFCHLGYSNKYGYEILDGKQRLLTLKEFYENKFSYKGYFYNDLCEVDKRFFERYNISYAEITEDVSRASKLATFIALPCSFATGSIY